MQHVYDDAFIDKLIVLCLGVPETPEVKEAHVRCHTEEWSQPS